MPESKKRKRKPRTGRDIVFVPIRATKTGRVYRIGGDRAYIRGASLGSETRRAVMQAKADMEDQLQHPEDYAE